MQSGYADPAYSDSTYAGTDVSDPDSVASVRRRASSSYVLMAVGALALFAIAMFVTILLMR
jgi:hypothetical protein